MAGESLLPIQECPDLISETLCFVLNEDSNLQDDVFVPLFYAERDTVLDAAFSNWGEKDATTGTLKIQRFDGTTTTDMSSTLDITQDEDITYPFTITETANIIPAGSILGLIKENGNTAFKWATFQMRIRTRIRDTA